MDFNRIDTMKNVVVIYTKVCFKRLLYRQDELLRKKKQLTMNWHM